MGPYFLPMFGVVMDTEKPKKHISYVHVREEYGSACFIIHGESVGENHDNTVPVMPIPARSDSLPYHPELRPKMHKLMPKHIGMVKPVSDDYSKVLCLKVRPRGTDVAAQPIGFVTVRKCDGHKDLWLCRSDGTTRRFNKQIPQAKHMNIPRLCEIVGIGKEWEVTLNER